jgi:predicted RNA-binding Zn ribbon-like protein
VDFTNYAQQATALVNAPLESPEQLRAYLAARPWLSERVGQADLGSLRELQRKLSLLVDASAAGDGPAAVRLLNELLARHPIRPTVSGHDATSWHLHVNDDTASVSETISSEVLFGLALLVTELGATRIGRCAATDCDNAYIDTSANSSRRFCSTRCSTRTNVAALRRRKQAELDPAAGGRPGVSVERASRNRSRSELDDAPVRRLGLDQGPVGPVHQ